jgi:hypothetical protein
MGKVSVLDNTVFNNDDIHKANYNLAKSSFKKPNFNAGKYSLTVEVGKNIFHYLRSYNLFKEPDMLVIPSNQHYYYDENNLKNIRTLVILKKLNLIKDRDTFLKTLYRMLSPNVNFIGCFSDSKTHKRYSLLSKLSNGFNNLLDSRTDHGINKMNVAILLEKYGFNIVNMTEINGLTYFYSQNVIQPIKIRA